MKQFVQNSLDQYIIKYEEIIINYILNSYSCWNVFNARKLHVYKISDVKSAESHSHLTFFLLTGLIPSVGRS